MSSWIARAAVLSAAGWLLGCAAPAPASPVKPRATASLVVTQAASMAQSPCTALDSDARAALSTLERLGMITGCEEASPGVLRLLIGDNWNRAPAEYHLNHLFNGYTPRLDDGRYPMFELWKDGTKVGEYTIDGLVYGPELTNPR